MARRGTFGFELSKPSKKGTLMKQGSIHKAFKYRYFVLYPGFLVYYDSENKWRFDLAKGETLGNRIGAIKLKNGTVSVAREAPKGCKFGLLVHAPDPVNKRQTYLLNAVNKGDRDDWITAVRKAIPRSPKQARKEIIKPEEKEKESKRLPVVRQDTATAAALLDSGNEEEEMETSIDIHLSGSNGTAEAPQTSAPQQPEKNEETEEEEGHELTAVDEELVQKAIGAREENGRTDSSDDEMLSDNSTPTSDVISNGHASPLSDLATGEKCEPEAAKEPEAEQLEAERKVQSSLDIEGKVEVVTSVKVQSSSGSDGEGEGEGERQPAESQGEKLRRESAEVAIAEVKTALTVTMVRDNTVEVPDSETDSDDDSNGDEEATTVPPPLENETSEPPEEGEPPEKEEEEDPPSCPSEPETPSTPVITIDKVPTLKRSEVVESDTMTKEEEEAVAAMVPRVQEKRRCSAPFIEKRGFLYKEGGQRKTWKLRYFVLQPGMFSYYKTSSTAKPLGEVKLKNLQIRYPGQGERKQSFQFIVHTESAWNKRHDYVIAAQTNAEMKEWISAFKLAGQKNTTPCGTPPGSSEDETTPPS